MHRPVLRPHLLPEVHCQEELAYSAGQRTEKPLGWMVGLLGLVCISFIVVVSLVVHLIHSSKNWTGKRPSSIPPNNSDMCDTDLCARAYAHTHMHARTPTRTHAHTHMHSHTHTCTHTLTHTHTHALTHTHAHTQYLLGRKYCEKRKVFSLALKDDRVEQCLRSCESVHVCVYISMYYCIIMCAHMHGLMYICLCYRASPSSTHT